ncbi:uncharacterized protein LOC129602573 [Paramacrobiotus metropolitanus]|uniref:uncharacterized protein LOC129602573 n=1 Tax=Paramacrobiotus metropolitanus TaxID=2943436 RepID=UPI00244595C5|nr:uncharacterized protein LOC129602573 [Paramacrobiotus metropolitanus]
MASYPVANPGGPTVTTPLTGTHITMDRQVVTTTVTETRVRGRRVRLFLTGFLQLIFGGFSLIPVLLLAQNPVTIAACAWLAFSGMVGCIGACLSSNKSSTSVKYDAATRTQKIMTVPPIFPKFYMGMMVVGFLLAVASAIQGIVLIATHPWWYVNFVLGPLATGIGVFFALNQMIMICCVSPMVQSHTSSAEQVHVQPVAVTVAPPSTTYGAGAYQAGAIPYQAGPSAPSSSLYPYIDEPVKEDPPSYSEATRFDHPQKTPTAPEF